MAEGAFVAYYRVSTERQGRSGLGLDAQRKAVEDFLNGGNWRLVAEFTEIESGKQADRPALAKAFRACRLHGAKLVIAKLDRLSRDAHFLLGLEKAGVDFVAADMPTANRLTVGIMAMVADEERRLISKRTKEALAAAKARGAQLGGNRGCIISAEAREISRQARQAASEARAADLAPVIAELQAAGATSLGGLARGLNERGIPTARGDTKWTPVQVSRVLAKLSV
jgi:DNA invertase Pin-like site-specific DNA recombinase